MHTRTVSHLMSYWPFKIWYGPKQNFSIQGGELFERVIEEDYILTEKACTVFMRQICEAVEFIHSKNILHLDLKPENVELFETIISYSSHSLSQY